MSEPRKKAIKPTAREHAERVDFVGQCLGKLLTRTQIHRACEEKWGVHWRSADRYMVRAKELLRERCRMPKDEARELGLTVILDCLKSPNASIRLRAEERLAMITGYEPPRRSEITGADGGPVAVAEKVVILELPALDDRPAQDEKAVADWRREHARGVAGNGGGGVEAAGGEKSQEQPFAAQDWPIGGPAGNGHGGATN